MPKLIYHKAKWWRDHFNVYGFYFQNHEQLTLITLDSHPWFNYNKCEDGRKTYTLLLDRRNIFVERYSKYKI